MADYYDMQEVMEKLRKTEDEIQELVKQGQLRQYLDDGKPVFKTEDIDNIAEDIFGLDITAFGKSEEELDLDLGETSQLFSEEPAGAKPEIISKESFEETAGMQLQETSEFQLTSDEDGASDKPGPDDLELDIQPDVLKPESEGGFGLSQMGDLSMADTNVGSLGINILSGSGDAYKLTEDTKAETMADEIDEIESLDGDSNMESLGSGSGLLDLSLQADDTSLGAVLDDILPTGTEGGDFPSVQDAGINVDEAADLLAEPEPMAAGRNAGVAEVASAEPMMASQVAAKMVPMGIVDPKTNIFGLMMMLPVLGLILLAIVLTAAAQGVVPSIVKVIIDTQIAGSVGLIWAIVGGLTLLMLLILAFTAVSGGGGGTKTQTKKEKQPKPKKEKKAKKRK